MARVSRRSLLPGVRGIVVVAAVLLVGWLLWRPRWSYSPDDTYIYAVYAQNAAQGNGLTYNGTWVEGFSSPFWALLLAAAAALTRQDAFALSKWLSLGFSVLSLALLGRAAAGSRGASAEGARIWWISATAAGALWVFALGSSPTWVLWAGAGLEGPAYALVLGLCASAVALGPDSFVGPRLLAVAVALLPWLRPEGIFLALPVAAAVALRFRNRSFLLAGALSTLALLALRLLIYGVPLSNTYYAKTGRLADQIARGLLYLRGFASENRTLVLAAALLAAVLVLGALRRRDAAAGLWLGAPLALAVAVAAFVVAGGGDWMPCRRMLLPVLFLAALFVALGLGTLGAARPGLGRAVYGGCSLLAAAVLLAGNLARQAETRTPAILSSPQGNESLGRYLAKKIQPGQSIAVIDAGAEAYFAGVRTIDMVGLNDTHIGRLPGGFFDKFDNDYVLAQQPQAIVFHVAARGRLIYPTHEFLGTVRLFWDERFYRWYDNDPRSHARQVFWRRAQPRQSSIAEDGFACVPTVVDGDPSDGTIAVSYRNAGKFIWPAPRAPYEHFGMLSAVVTASRGGKVVETAILPAAAAVGPGEEFAVRFSRPGSAFDSVTVDLRLNEVRDFSSLVPSLVRLPAGS